MRKSACFFLILSLIFTTFYCSKKVNQSGVKPPKVIMIPAASDTSRVEKGIDAVPEGNSIRVEWIPSSDDNVIGYEIFRRADVPGAKFVKITPIAVAVPDTFYEDPVPQVGVRYFYTILAVNDEDLKSESGDTLSYLLLQKATSLSPKGEITNNKPAFSWADNNQPPANEYIIRVMDSAIRQYVWVSVVQADYGNPVQSITFNSDSKAVPGTLVSGKEYRWRIDIRGQNTSGSESEWVTLKIR